MVVRASRHCILHTWFAERARAAAADPRAAALDDAPRSGRPPKITVEQRCQLIQLACERPQDAKKPVPFRNVWTHRSLAEGFKLLTGVSISASEVGRILRFEELRPHRSIDEKPMQALARIHPTRVDPRDASLRHEYEYKRNGTQSLLGASWRGAQAANEPLNVIIDFTADEVPWLVFGEKDVEHR